MKMKKLLLVLLVFSLVGALVMGCSQDTADPDNGDNGDNGDKLPPGEKIELAFALHTAPGGPDHRAVEYFKGLLEERTNGQIEVVLFPGGVLGGERDNLEQLKSGEIGMSQFGEFPMFLHAAEYFPMGTPYVFPTNEHVQIAMNGDIGQKINAALNERADVQLLGFQRRGARNLTADREAVTPDAIAGLKFRVPEITQWVTVWKELGTQPTPIAWPEVFGALQTGVVSGQENPLYLIYTTKLFEVQSHVMLTEHVHAQFYWLVGNPFYNKLTPELQEILKKTVKDAAEYGDNLTAEMDEGYKDLLKEAGMTIVIPDKDAFREKAMPGIEEVSKEWADGIAEEVERIISQ